jgi:hypothetical protein
MGHKKKHLTIPWSGAPSGRGGGGGGLPDINILLITHFLSTKKSYF